MKKLVLISGLTMLLLGMGLNLQYALDDYGWADNLVIQILATTGDINTSWPDPNKPVEAGTIAVTKSCMYIYPDGSFTGSVQRVCEKQYVCPTCNCTPVPCGGEF